MAQGGAGKPLGRARAVVRVLNFCRVHKTLPVTPAIAAGIANREWSLRELLEAA